MTYDDYNPELYQESVNYLLNEASKTGGVNSSMNDKVVTKLFNNVKTLMNSKDNEIVDKSKGEFKKLDCYNTLYRAEATLLKIAEFDSANKKASANLKVKYNQLKEARENLIKYEAAFKKGYSTHNTIVTNIYKVNAINYITCMGTLIAGGVKVERDSTNRLSVVTNSGIMDKSIEKKFSSLEEFNTLCKKGHMHKTLTAVSKDAEVFREEYCMSLNESKAKDIMEFVTLSSKELKEKFGKFYDNNKALVIVAGTFSVLMIILLCLSRIAHAWFNTKSKLSDYLEECSLLIKLNTADVTNEHTKAKQLKTAERFERWSKKISLDNKVAISKGEEEAKITSEEIINSVSEEVKKENEVESQTITGDYF